MSTVQVHATGQTIETASQTEADYYLGEANTVGGYTIDGVEYPAKVDVPVTEADAFDPADHTVAEVEEHLAESTPAEAERVLDVERHGKDRKTLVGDEPVVESVEVES